MIAETTQNVGSYSAHLVYYSIIAVFTVLVVAVVGMVFLSMSNHTKSAVLKHWFEDLGLAFMVVSAVLVMASFVVVPFFAKNEHYRNSVIVSSETTIVEDGSVFVVVA